jgi:hypothetical protein
MQGLRGERGSPAPDTFRPDRPDSTHWANAAVPESMATDRDSGPVAVGPRFTLLGVGAMNSPRYAPAGLLIEHGRVRVAIDGGLGAEPAGRLVAWLVTDERAELIRELRRLATARTRSSTPPIRPPGT